jgi:hypothetical protein
LALSISFRSGLLILEISEIKEGFKYDSLENIYLSPTKARILATEVEKFKEYLKEGNIDPNKAFGVNAGMNEKVSYIGFHASSVNNINITIGKIDSNGQILEQATIALNTDYHYGLEWDNIESMDLSKDYYDYIELDQLHDLFVDFSRSMSGAYGYSAIDLGKYDLGRVLSKMDPIYDKLGIERRNNGTNSSYGRPNNFLENSGRVNSNHTTVDDILD